MVDGSSTLELESVSNPCNYLANEAQAFAEQQQSQCISLVYAALDGHLCELA